MMKKNVIISKIPMLGMGVTINYLSDETPATIIQLTHNDKRMVIQEDKATRIDNNGVSESQEYTYTRDPDGAIHIATMRRNGQFRISGGQQSITLDVRRKYWDYSF